MILGVPKEINAGENRVALVPETVAKLVKAGYQVRVERGAGLKAYHSAADYEKAGAVLASVEEVFSSEIVVKVAAPAAAEVARLKQGTVTLGFLNPLAEPSISGELA